jgi:tetratricopeptide (TPR) repeat protein
LTFQGKYDESEKLFRQSLTIRETLFPVGDHPDIAESLGGLGYLFATMGMYLSSSAYLDRAVKILEETLGNSHPETVSVLSSAAWVLFKQGKLEEAMTSYKFALEVREKYFGQEHPEVARSLHEIAEVLMKQEKYSEAIPLEERALAIRLKILGPVHVIMQQIGETHILNRRM